jgi:hypothetical protein
VSITYLCDKAVGCTFTRWDGDVTPDEWNDHIDRLIYDPAFPPGLQMLIDLRTASTDQITGDVIEQVAERWHNLAAGMPELRAAVVPSEAREKAERFAELLEASNLRLNIFQQVAAACAWLNIDEDIAKTALQELRPAEL